MHRFLALVCLLFLSAPSQAQTDALQQRFKAARSLRESGQVAQAEAEYSAALVEAYATLGRLLSAEGEYEKAARALERAAAGSGSESALINLAITYFYAGQYEKAVEPLNKVLAGNPGSFGAHHMLGKVNFMLRRFDQSAAELETALKLAPDDVDVSYTLALAYLKQKKLDRARAVFNLMAGKLGDSPQLHLLFGRAFRETEYLAEAIGEFKSVIALAPTYPRAHYYLGLTYLLNEGASKLKEAEAEFKAELATRPEDFFALYNLGLVYMTGKQYEQAVSFLEKASHLRPGNPFTYLYLGTSYYGLRQYGQAIEFLEKFMALNPDFQRDAFEAANARFLLGQSLVKVGRREEAERELEAAKELKAKALAQDRAKATAYMKNEEYSGDHFGRGEEEETVASKPNAPDAKRKEELKEAERFYARAVAEAHSELGLLQTDRQNFRAAAEQFRQAAEWNPGQAGLNYNWGLASYKAELYREAIAPLELEFKAHPANMSVRQLLGMSYFMVDNYAGASGLLRTVIAARPGNVGLYYALSVSLMKQGKTAEANEVIQKMLAATGESPQIHILLGQAYYGQNDAAKALAELNKALEMDQRTLTAHYYSGLIYLKMGRFDEAARQFQAELELNPNDFQAEYHLAFILLSQQQTDRGTKLLREVIRLKPDYADARFELGKTLLQQGDVTGAIENLEVAVRLGPDKPHLYYQLCRAYQTAGRSVDSQKCLETFRQLKDKARQQPNQ
jgi:tetratricopeptide (TPR) repeat protein